MVRQRKEKKAKDIKLRQPDRSAPTEKTLLQIAEERNLFKLADAQQRRNKAQDTKAEGDDDEEEEEEEAPEDGLSPTAERVLETLLYSTCLAMLHFTLDVLVQHQYAMEVEWYKIAERATQALMVFTALVYVLHPHTSVTIIVPGLPERYQPAIRQVIFLMASISAGCYLIHITDKYSYLYVLKQAPPLGCLWVWSIIELNLGLAVLSLAGAGWFFWQGGYRIW